MGKDIYKLKLHEEVQIGADFIRRVPGGWIYTEYTESLVGTGYTCVSKCFVPFDNEFQKA